MGHVQFGVSQLQLCTASDLVTGMYLSASLDTSRRAQERTLVILPARGRSVRAPGVFQSMTYSGVDALALR